MSRSRLSALTSNLLLAAIIFASAWAGYGFRLLSGFPPAAWFTVGITVAVYLRCLRYWPGVCLGSFTFYCLIDAYQSTHPLPGIMLATVGATFGPWLGVYLFRRWFADRPTLSSIREVIAYVFLVLGLGIGIGTTLKIAGIWVGDATRVYSLSFAYKAWWIDGAIAALLIGGGSIALSASPTELRKRYGMLDWQHILILVSAVTLGTFNYTPLGVYNTSVLLRPYLFFPIAMWAALKWDILGALFILFVAVTCASIGLFFNYVPGSIFGRMQDTVLVHELLILVLGMTGMVIAAALREKEDAERAKSIFLANMSHELRTPLGVVLGYTELLGNPLVPAADVGEMIKIIKRNSDHLLRLIDDVLSFSKAESGKLDVELISFSPTALISSVANDLKPFATAKMIDLRIVSSHSIPEVIVSDPVRLQQILHNVVGNAIKFTDKGSVEIQLSTSGPCLVIRIKDTGIGLTPTQQKGLFTAFSQADASHARKYGGTGLGLALSKRLAQLLGGDLQLLESTADQGSLFEIKIFARRPPAEVPVAKPALGAPSIKLDLPGVKILLAEDSPDNARLLKKILTRAGAVVDVADNGIAAVDRAAQDRYDLILMDIQMPHMDGYQATRTLREGGCALPIVALTAHAMSEHRAKAMSLGFTDYLVKPVESTMLISSIKSNLARENGGSHL